MDKKETLYARWLEGKITDEEAEALKKSGEWAELEAIAKATDGWSVPAYDAAAGYAKFKANRPNKTAKIRTLRPRWVMGIAASILLLAAMVLVLRDTTVTLQAGASEHLSYQLPDNSIMTLNYLSTAVFDEKNWRKNRTIQLTGEAYFEVEKGEKFTVITSNGTVEVLGTKFNVRNWESNFYTACYEGKVKVKQRDSEVILTEKESVKSNGIRLENKKSIEHTGPLWEQGIYRFENKDLKVVFEAMERQFDVKIEATSLGNRTFSGQFQTDDLQIALQAVCRPMGLDFEINRDEVRVFEK